MALAMLSVPLGRLRPCRRSRRSSPAPTAKRWVHAWRRWRWLRRMEESASPFKVLQSRLRDAEALSLHRALFFALAPRLFFSGGFWCFSSLPLSPLGTAASCARFACLAALLCDGAVVLCGCLLPLRCWPNQTLAKLFCVNSEKNTEELRM